MIGQTLGHYRIESKLGEGGMGVVYRAADLNLNRPVAIKFLSNELADENQRRRFQREAQAASSLNRPHILTVFETGTSEGREYLVTGLSMVPHCGSGPDGSRRRRPQAIPAPSPVRNPPASRSRSSIPEYSQA
jgi:serine/threonine protein kinase